ncbi:MAG: DUF6298 domain-containing protein [Aeoliella sp.]
MNRLIRRREFLIKSSCAVMSPLAVSLPGECPSAIAAEPSTPGAVDGPLRVHPDNPRYFIDRSGRAVYVTGSHVWNNLVDMGLGDPPPKFNFDEYLDFFAKYGHNFIRLWTWEHSTWDTSTVASGKKDLPHIVAPHPWERTGPGKALDEKPKFDLTKFNEDYFERLRSRVIAAGKQEVYVSVMLFEGWGVQFAPGAWNGHPLNARNNINGVAGDANSDGMGLEIHTLTNPAITRHQEAYVKKVIDTVNDLDNVLYEISNENHAPSSEWQYHMIRFVKTYEKAKPKQHPVGMTIQTRGTNETLLESPADWISPYYVGEPLDDPPAADGSKVIISDTDHLWGIGGNPAWVWKSFARGLNPIFMDPYDGQVLARRFDPQWDPVRRAMGYTLRLARRMNLASMTPHGELASSKYCLADSGREYLVYAPAGGEVTVDLSAAKGELNVEWFDPTHGKSIHGGKTNGGDRQQFNAPFDGHAVLYLS